MQFSFNALCLPWGPNYRGLVYSALPLSAYAEWILGVGLKFADIHEKFQTLTECVRCFHGRYDLGSLAGA